MQGTGKLLDVSGRGVLVVGRRQDLDTLVGVQSMNDIIRALDERISALQMAKRALIAAFAGDADLDLAVTAKRRRRRARKTTLRLPQAIEAAITREWQTPAEITDAILAGGWSAAKGRQALVGQIRNALNRLHEARGWEKRSVSLSAKARPSVQYRDPRKGTPRGGEQM